MASRALEPYVVLDFTDERGEIGAMLLGDLGADVLRIEPPGGSPARGVPPFLEAAESAGSLPFTAFNRNKRSIVLDPDEAEDAALLERLIRRADFVFESARSIETTWGLTRDDIASLNSRIVHVRLTAFGDDGPHAGLPAADLTIAAMGGPVALQGTPERAPIRISVPQVWRHAGAEAAVAAMVAHARQRRTGEPQFVDVSAQCAMTWTMLNAMDAWGIQGFEFQRTGSAVTQSVGNTQLVHPTRDGYLVAIPMGQVLRGCTEALIADGLVDESFRAIDWDEFQANLLTPEKLPISLEECLRLCRAFFALHDKQELFELGLRVDAALAPVNTLPELLALEHLVRREYWRRLDLGDGRVARAPGLWGKGEGLELSVRRPAPRLDQHGEQIRSEYAAAEHEREVAIPDHELPFAGIRVADFAWVGVGPISSKFLADHGADVVRVESEGRPDVLRGGMPFKDGERGWNRSQFFGDFNTSKRSLALDLKCEAGIELAKRLIAASDVFIESFAPGAIERMGLDYHEVSRLHPDLIMISTCLMGQTGPAAPLAGYGYHAAAIAGFYEVTGWPDLPPSAPWVAYTDTIAPRFVSLLLAAALDHRRRTGKGCYIDVAQIETALHFLAPELLDFQVNGYAARRMGNRSRFFAPQGVYRCDGDDDWCAIAVESEVQWQALCTVVGASEWAADAGLATHEGRCARHDEIDRGISRWTRARTRQEVFDTLTAAGVPAGIVQRSRDLLSDPQYRHREFYRYLEHPEMGRIPYAGHQYRISGYDSGPRGPAPCIGEHSYEVLTDYLGLSPEEVAEAFASGAIS